ncbi:diaminopimelate decarboxylase [Bdellovibrio sp. SKB1291214]|uniref:diaminopimelate decarboxylase n=1 Tax=Bdellovibrio sp. SKB1291214 TaxID=1732569 RepID=UPI000B5175B3|nr:diaminopimelate decarboxylase [Bdellovibrio sp. SKB1291214]UYL08193.1 diaminopimelate decarboxylase [Bdellovibrio sp. SKB1291214]
MEYINNELHFGPKKKNLSSLCANYIRPIYVYDLDFIRSRFQQLAEALAGVRLYFAVKANPNPQVLQCLKSAGAGADVVSLGEIKRALESGFLPEDIVYSGVGKTRHEITEALQLGVLQINVESLPELQRIGEIAEKMGKKAQVALRLNPDVSIQTHPYIATGLRDNKFGMELSMIPALSDCLKKNTNSLELVGVSLHLGSQMLEFSGYQEALIKLKASFLSLQKDFPTLRRFDFGGGLGVVYEKQDFERESSLLKEYSAITKDILSDLKCELQSEPGRWLVAHAGVLLTQVQYIKKTSAKTFVIVDSGMNHLIRPSLYEAEHQILPLVQSNKKIKCDVVGPICESSDFFLKDYEMGQVEEGDYLAVLDSGAYGYSMASTYNLQELPLEICI